MAKPMCSVCENRFAQTFKPRLCRGCATGRRVDPRESRDDSPAEIERSHREAMRQIRWRRQVQPSQECQ